MKVNLKPCKAIGIAKPSDIQGCGKEVLVRKFGLCKSCLAEFYINTPEGKEKLAKATLNASGSHEKQQTKEWNKEKNIRKKALKRKQDYEKDLERVFNEFIRLRDKDQPCISCDATEGTYKITAGHYFPAGHYKNIRFDEDNVHGQCWFNCNKNRHGNLLEYQPRLIDKIGKQAFDELTQRRLEERRYTIPELVELLVIYKDKVKGLK